MGKYKDGTKSTLISSIPVGEIREACKEWANGNEAMAECLYMCYKNGLETFGNHFGPKSYIDFIVNNSHKTIKSILKYMQDIDGAMIYISPDGGNPFANEEAFWKPTMTIGFGPIEKKEKHEEIIRGITATIIDSSSKEEIEDGAFNPMLDAHDFFAGKGSNLKFRAKYADGQYIFSIENMSNSAKNTEYFKALFEKAGLTYEKNEIVDEWTIVSDKTEEFREKIMNAMEIIETNWTYEKPTQIEEYMGWNETARIKREQYGETPEGKEKFKEWLKEWQEEEFRKNKMREAVSQGLEEKNVGNSLDIEKSNDVIQDGKTGLDDCMQDDKIRISTEQKAKRAVNMAAHSKEGSLNKEQK